MNKIKILYILDIHQKETYVGGVEFHVLDLLKHMPRDRFDVVLVTDNSVYASHIKFILPYTVSMRLIKKRTKFIGDIFFLYDLYRIIRHERPDIVHAHKLKSSVWGRFASSIAGVPVIFSTVHGAPSFWKFGFLRNAINHFLNTTTTNYCSTATIALSKYEKEMLISSDKIKPTKIEVIYLGLFERSQLENKKRFQRDSSIIVVGRLNWEKNQLFLLRVFKEIVKIHPEIKLKIVGDGPDKEKLKQYAQVLHIEQSVVFYGEVSRDEVFQLLQTSCMLVIPSLWESFPYVAIEAMYAGLPIIASRVGGLHEAVEEGKGGFLVEPDMVDDLKNKICMLYEDSSLREQCGEYNRTKALALYDGNRMIDNHVEIYLKYFLKK